MEVHPFWRQACQVLDPRGVEFTQHLLLQQVPIIGGARSASLQTPSTYSQYIRILRNSCLPCRFSNPQTSIGVRAGKDWIIARPFKHILACSKHDAYKFCGCCFKDVQLSSVRYNGQGYIMDPNCSTISPVDDDPYFEDVMATCGPCRRQAIWTALRFKGIGRKHELAHQIVEQFVDSGESPVKDVVQEVEERFWLSQYSNYSELYQSALVAEKMRFKQEMRMSKENNAARARRSPLSSEDELEDTRGRRDGRSRLEQLLDSSAPVSPSLIERELERVEADDEEEEEYDDYYEEYGEMLTFSEESNVRDMALSGWSRNRIMEGCWISPMDLAGKHAIHLVETPNLERFSPAHHPVDSYHGDSTPPDSYETAGSTRSALLAPSTPHSTFHPSLETLRTPPPPARLLYRSQTLFEYNLRQILNPALHNLVRRHIYEAEVSGKDVCRTVVSMTSLKIMQELQKIQLWGVEYSWGSTDNQVSDENQTSPTTTVTHTLDSESGRGSPSSTIRITPSPPPSNALPELKTDTQTTPSPSLIPIPTRFVQHIPFVPTAIEHIGPQGLQLIGTLWREACSGLFQCQCRICMRASGLDKASKIPPQAQAQIQTWPAPVLVTPPVTVPSMPYNTVRHRSPDLMEELEEVETASSDDLSSLGPATPPDVPRRRSRDASEGLEEDDSSSDGPDRKRVRVTPTVKSDLVGVRLANEERLATVPEIRRRRSRDEADLQSLNSEAKKMRMGIASETHLAVTPTA